MQQLRTDKAEMRALERYLRLRQLNSSTIPISTTHALSLDAKTWAAVMSAWGIASKIALFLVQYAVMTAVGKRRAAAAATTGMAAT